MSRRLGVVAVALFLTASVVPVPVSAQNAPPPSAEDVIESARRAYSLPDPAAARAAACPVTRPGDDIVVCAPAPSGDFGVESGDDLERGGLRGAGRRAPDVATAYPGSVAATGCFIGPCPPPMPVLIDLAAIPEAPEGSDADLIARGEKRL